MPPEHGYTFKKSKAFSKAFRELTPSQQQSAKAKLKIFKEDPFDARLGTHRIHKLSARYGRTIYSVVIENDLRAVFYIEGSTVYSVDIGAHDIYK